MISLLINLLILLIIVAVVYYVITVLPLPPKIKEFSVVICVVIAAIGLIWLLLGVSGAVPALR